MLLIKMVLLLVCRLSFFVDSSPVQLQENTYNGTLRSSTTHSQPDANVSDLYLKRFNESSTSSLNSRRKRSLSLVDMFSCGVPEDCGRGYLINYGNWCGPGGSGRPIDAHDRCCQKHDKCYDWSDCGFWARYFGEYNWSCFLNIPMCKYEQDNWCRKQLCECDSEFVRCLNDAEETLGYRLCSLA